MTGDVSMAGGVVVGGAFLLLREWETTRSQLGKGCCSKTWPRSDILPLNLWVCK